MSPAPQVLPCSQPSALVWLSWKEVVGQLVEPFREWGRASQSRGLCGVPSACACSFLHTEDP